MNVWPVFGGQWTKSQAFSRRSSPSITSTHSPETTRKFSWPVSRVVHAGGLAGLEHGNAHAELREVAVAFEVGPAAEPVPLPPASVPRVEHEPARALGAEAFGERLELRLRDHQSKSGRSPSR